MIIPIHAANPGPYTGAGNWTYLVPGPRPILVDAGVGKTEHLDAIAAHVPNGPAVIIVTHAHDDHASGVTALASRWPHTTFYKLPWPERDGRYPVQWTVLHDGDRTGSGAVSLEVVHTPGHAPDHICLWEAGSRTLLSGDLMVKGSTVVIPASHGGSLVSYLASLDRIAALAPARLLPSHGEVIEDPLPLIRWYKQHRAEREREVLGAVRDGLGTIDAITGRVYQGLAPALVTMARENVLAQLAKLEADGVLRRSGEGWQLCD